MKPRTRWHVLGFARTSTNSILHVPCMGVSYSHERAHGMLNSTRSINLMGLTDIKTQTVDQFRIFSWAFVGLLIWDIFPQTLPLFRLWEFHVTASTGGWCRRCDWLGRVQHPICMLVAMWDAHVKDIGKADCGGSSQSPKQEVTNDMKITWLGRVEFNIPWAC